ncbi:NnrU family protein [Roseibium aggregatum]|uniref:NnrU family protein n=1 Tax=Roseibium aggregatum TaxID=187304 RepID=A0A939EJA0_9HYPH|nr:NnrU family protein [Roseibium aggregatum]MBN9672715.1 NnrU family protein [Roseibium aggregatum]
MTEDGWTNFIAAFAVFFASHVLLVRPPVRPVLVGFLKPGGFSAAYSLLSLGILWWLMEAAQAAPYVELWPWAPWQNFVPVITMLPVCLILAFSIGCPNPFSFGGFKNERFDPQHPGIVKWMRHPILVALLLWSGAHIVPNGNLAHVILFGAFAVFSLAGMKIIDKRKRREQGEGWQALRLQMQSGAVLPGHSKAVLKRFAAAAAVYILLLLLHPVFAGVDPLASIW